MNSVQEVPEFVEVLAKSVWPFQKNGLVRSKSRKDVKLAAASGRSFQVEGDANLEFVREGMKCCMKFLDADVGIRLRYRGRRKQGRACSGWIVHRKEEHGSKDAYESETMPSSVFATISRFLVVPSVI